MVTSSDGYKVFTDSLCYDGTKRQISTGDPVLLEKEGMRVKGVGVVVDLNTEELYLQNAVETVIEG